MCSAKQSIRRVFAKSERAADIRGVVQSLNMKSGAERESAAEKALQQSNEGEEKPVDKVQTVPKEQSAWNTYITQPSASDDEDESDDADESTITTQWEHTAGAQRASRKVPT